MKMYKVIHTVAILTCVFLLKRTIAHSTKYIHEMHKNTSQFHWIGENTVMSAILSSGVFEIIVHAIKQSDGAPINISYSCRNDTEKIIEDVLNRQLYAMQFLDAAAKLPYGLLQGQWLWTGDYHECINIQSPFNTHTNHTFHGTYFSAAMNLQVSNSSQMLVIGFCLPSSCNKDDAWTLTELALSSFHSTGQLLLSNIYTAGRNNIDSSDIVAMVICCMIVVTVLLGTFMDYYQNVMSNNTAKGYTNIDQFSQDYANTYSTTNEQSALLVNVNKAQGKSRNKKALIFEIFKTFSFFTNSKKLVNTPTASGPLTCINGLRVISMCWVIQGHTYGFSELILKDPVYAVTSLSKRFSFQAILNGTYSVDTFFFLSGLLVAYVAMKEISEKGRLNWIYYFGHRYWRLTPIYALTLMFFTTIYTLLITGPLAWIGTDQDGPIYSTTNDCRKYWWTNLLYINNFYPKYGSETNCMGWGWYLANDMQFYMVLSPIIIILIHKNWKIGVAFCLFLIMTCIGLRAFTVIYYGMNQNQDISKHKDDPWGQNGPIYTKPYTRWSVYIVGMLTGYLLQTTKCSIRLNKLLTFIGWVTATTVGICVIYGLYDCNKNGTDLTETGTVFYQSLSRTAWSISLAWVVVACATERGWWVNSILSWKLWAPFGRLTYAAYLVHPMVLFGFYLNGVAPIQMSDILLIYISIANLVLSYAVAYIVSMAVEAPMMQLEKLILKSDI